MSIQQFKQKLLDQLYEPYKQCTQCPLGTQGRTNVVFGTGNADAKMMIVGEAPGQKEDEQGEPFIGRSGNLLTSILNECGIERKNIYITNIVKCRPPKNRNPTEREATTCKNLLLYNQINIINPSIIITLGSVAFSSLFETKQRISEYRGSMHYLDKKIPVIPAFHPAFALRNKTARTLLSQDIQHAKQLLSAKKTPNK
jgi:DNA polymerase